MKTTLLMVMLTMLLVVMGDYFAGQGGMMVMLLFSIGINFYYYWNSDKMVLAQYRAVEANRNSAPEVYGVVKELTERGNMPMPKVYVINSAVPNAFATGRNPEHAAVAVTSGLTEILTREELSGVIGHELSHVKHDDILIGTIAASMAGVITTLARWGMFFGGGRDDDNRNPVVGILVMLLAPIAAMVIQMAVSRSREYMADYSGGALCGNPEALASALAKIENIAQRRTLPNASEATAHMFIICPFSKADFSNLFSTHPPTAERIARLKEEAREMRLHGAIKFE